MNEFGYYGDANGVVITRNQTHKNNYSNTRQFSTRHMEPFNL